MRQRESIAAADERAARHGDVVEAQEEEDGVGEEGVGGILTSRCFLPPLSAPLTSNNLFLSSSVRRCILPD